MKSGRLNQAPLALTTSGEVLVNITYVSNVTSLNDPWSVIQRLLTNGQEVFVGVVASDRKLRRQILKSADNASAEIAATIGPKLARRRSR